MSKPLDLNRAERTMIEVAAAFGVDLKTAALLCMRTRADFIRALHRDRRLERQVKKSRRRGARVSNAQRDEAKPKKWRQAAKQVAANRQADDDWLAV